MKTTRERAEERRLAKLELVREQIEARPDACSATST